jgi:hypothetical protein
MLSPAYSLPAKPRSRSRQGVIVSVPRLLRAYILCYACSFLIATATPIGRYVWFSLM